MERKREKYRGRTSFPLLHTNQNSCTTPTEVVPSEASPAIAKKAKAGQNNKGEMKPIVDSGASAQADEGAQLRRYATKIAKSV
jgi:hypothetical protein